MTKKTIKKEFIAITNNMVLAKYDSSDPIKKNIINKLLERYSNALTSNINSLFNDGDIDYSPLVLDAKDYNTSKERLMEKTLELHKVSLVTFYYIIPGHPLTQANANLFGLTRSIIGTTKVEIEINKNIVPYLRYIGQYMEYQKGNLVDSGKNLDYTIIDKDHLFHFKRPFAARLYEFLLYQQMYEADPNIHGVFAPVLLDAFMNRFEIKEAYKRPDKLKKRILEPAMKEIYEKTGSLFIYDLFDGSNPYERKRKNNTQKRTYIRFTLAFSPGQASCFDDKIKTIYNYLVENNIDNEIIDKVIYKCVDINLRDELFDEIELFLKSKKINRFKAKSILLKDINQILDEKKSTSEKTHDNKANKPQLSKLSYDYA